MRILSLGFPIPGVPIDNYTFANAPTFFDYDAIVVDPLALSQLIEDIKAGTGDHRTRSGEPITNAATRPGHVALADVLGDRRDETAQLLRRGGLVVCFAYPDAAHEDIPGMDECDRYWWLAGAPSDGALRRGAGAEVVAVEHGHPFGALIEQMRGLLAYQAYFAEEATAGARVFAQSPGGAAIGVDLEAEDGRIVFLPPPARPLAPEQRYALSEALQEAVRGMLRLSSGSEAPQWLVGYELPGSAERRAAVEEAQKPAKTAGDEVEAAKAALEEIDRFRRILWQEGSYGLDEPVRAALALLGFKVSPAALDAPARIEHGGRSALLEIAGSTGQVGMTAHYRLRQRLERSIADGRPQRGVLIVNGRRTQAPESRREQYDDALRNAAETMRYCLATTVQLFHAVRAALEGDDATVRAFRERLLTIEGILTED